MKQKITALILVVVMIISFAACSSKKVVNDKQPIETGTNPVSSAPEIDYDAKFDVNLGLLKGPTGMGAIYILENDADGQLSNNNYNYTIATSPSEITSALISGSLDIAAVPTNVAATLYNKTEGEIQIAALNTLGVLYILSGENVELESLADLKGKTIYATGQGANPEYVLSYLLEKNGLEIGKDVTVEFAEGDEIALKMAAGEIDLCMLPVPNATSVLMKNDKVKIAFDLTEQWDAVTDDGSVLTMGCIVVRREYAEENPLAVARFLAEYEVSVDYVNSSVDEAAELIAKFGITGNAQIAKAAIPDCNLTWISGDDVKPAIEGYYKVLFDADPSSIGGALPDDDFYYENIYD